MRADRFEVTLRMAVLTGWPHNFPRAFITTQPAGNSAIAIADDHMVMQQNGERIPRC